MGYPARQHANRQRVRRADVPRRLVQQLQEEMAQAAKDLRFEEAARLRDEINELKRELRAAG